LCKNPDWCSDTSSCSKRNEGISCETCISNWYMNDESYECARCPKLAWVYLIASFVFAVLFCWVIYEAATPGNLEDEEEVKKKEMEEMIF
jgi:hypothetical protein